MEGTCCMFCPIYLVGMDAKILQPKRVYHYIATTVTTISTLSYFSMATYVGAVMVHAAIHDPQGPRPEIYERILYQVYWARYVDWTLTLPLTLLIISMISGLDLASVFAVVVAAFIMVLSGFFSMASHNKGEKFGWLVPKYLD